MTEEREYTVKVLTIKMRKAILKQLPVLHGLAVGQRERFKPICWFNGRKALGRKFYNVPYILGTLDGDPALFVDSNPGYADAHTLMFRIGDGQAVGMRFAVVT